MPYRVAALAGHATVYDAEDNAVCQTKGPDAEATANRIARALAAERALLDALEKMLFDHEPKDPKIGRQAREAIAAARGEVTA